MLLALTSAGAIPRYATSYNLAEKLAAAAWLHNYTASLCKLTTKKCIELNKI